MSKDKSKKKSKDTKKKVSTKAAAAAKDNGRMFLARVYIALKPTVNDPEGITIGNALGSLGFEAVQGVRSGRYFQVTLNAKNAKGAEQSVDQMCARLLANPVIETYSFELAQI